MDLQAMMDGMSARMQRERADTQMTLGELIKALEALPAGASVELDNPPRSYRGYYSDLAFETSGGVRPVSDVLKDCREAMGKVFHGYKGGEYVMGELTPVWIASYGCTGRKLMGFGKDGSLLTQADDY